MDFKRGSTFDFSGQLTVVDGGTAVTDFTGWTGSSQLRASGGGLISELQFTWLDPSGLIRIKAIGSTEEWPICEAEIDIRLSSLAGDVVFTDTTLISIVKEITRAP